MVLAALPRGRCETGEAVLTIYTGPSWEVREGRWQDSPLETCDHVISDPPYSEHVHAKQWIGAALTSEGRPRVSTAFKELGFASITDAEKTELISALAKRVARWILVFADLEGISGWRTAALGSGMDYVRACIWDKIDGAPQFTGDRPASGAEAIVCIHRKGKKRWNCGGRRGVFNYAVNGDRGSKPHPSTKPLPLMLDLVEAFTDPGDLVWDPYCGSGTTGVACLRLGRRFIGHEMQPHYAKVAAERLAAEDRGLTLADVRRGQTSILDRLTP